MKLRKLTANLVKNKRVIFRVGYDVPLSKKGKNFVVADDSRIKASLETLKFLQKNNAKIIILTWLKRPDGTVVEDLRLDPVAKHLAQLIKHSVYKLDDCVGKEVEGFVNEMEGGDIIVLENVRFHKEEDKNSTTFAKQLARLGDVVVFDAFSHAHRDVASTTGILKLLPGVAGFSMTKEVTILSKLLGTVKHPFTVVFGGAKVSDKIGILERFLPRADHILIGGAMAHAFLDAKEIALGKSLREKYADKAHHTTRSVALRILKDATAGQIILPTDLIATNTSMGRYRTVELTKDKIKSDEIFVDIGPYTTRAFGRIIKQSKTLFWNGPMGLFEKKPFDKGTAAIARAVALNKGMTVLGGGDTQRAVNTAKLAEKYTYVSTGGGASLDFLAHGTLPVIEYLK
ncbi:MAG: phosphoglycerate kinase [bacterium]|nr:phosphoglycerate kinase [bacterium]